MEKLKFISEDFRIYKAGRKILFEIAKFVVNQNYSHHQTLKNIPQRNLAFEINSIYKEELEYSKDSANYVATTNQNQIFGTIRVFKWDKKAPTPMEKLFNFSPLEIDSSKDASYWHIGRFAIDNSKRKNSLNLFKLLMLIASRPVLNNANGYMLAEIDAKLLKVVNMLGLNTESLGSSINYLGSETIPIVSTQKDIYRFHKKHIDLVGKIKFE